MKEESEKSLKLNIWKTKIMTSGPISSWQIDGETMITNNQRHSPGSGLWPVILSPGYGGEGGRGIRIGGFWESKPWLKQKLKSCFLPPP